MSDERRPDGPPGTGDTGGTGDLGDPGDAAIKAALNRARAAARARGLAPGSPAVRPGTGRRRRVDAQASGAHPDARDPQRLGATVDRLVTDRGWDTTVAVAAVIGRWDTVVGADVAAHCRPDSFVDGVLTVVTDSSAWAAGLKLQVPLLMRRLAEEVGEDTVSRIVVRGPSGPSWRRGPRVAPGGQGPRDTYG